MEVLKYNNLSFIKKKPKDKKEKYPAIIFLHGAGTRGNDIAQLKENPFFAEKSFINQEDFSFLVFAPQCFADSWFDIFEQLEDFAKMVAAESNVDSSRVYLIGASMGGYAVWQLAMSLPQYFAAIIPICGGGMYWNTWRLHEVPVWAVHGEKDEVVFPEESIKMVNGIKKQGGNAVLSLLPNVEHNSWNYVYENKKFFDWLLLHKKESTEKLSDASYQNTKKFG